KSLLCCTRMLLTPRFFLFYILKKIKFQKYMSVFKYFKNIPRSPSHRATGPMCNFFFQICNEVPGKKKQALSPVGGAMSPVGGAKGACRPPLRRQGPVARWGGRQPPPPFFFSDF